MNTDEAGMIGMGIFSVVCLTIAFLVTLRNIYLSKKLTKERQDYNSCKFKQEQYVFTLESRIKSLEENYEKDRELILTQTDEIEFFRKNEFEEVTVSIDRDILDKDYKEFIKKGIDLRDQVREELKDELLKGLKGKIIIEEENFTNRITLTAKFIYYDRKETENTIDSGRQESELG